MRPDSHFTFNSCNLGDNLFQLHFLRKLALKYAGHEFTHAAHGCHLPQMAEVVDDMPQIKLIPLEDHPPFAFNSWKAADGFFQNHPTNWNYYEFYLDWFAHHARQLGLETPFSRMEDLLFDYPALLKTSHRAFMFGERPFDILFVNSQPCSGQWLAYDDLEQRRKLNELALELCGKAKTIVTQKIEIDGKEVMSQRCTAGRGLTVTDIGHISQFARMIVMIGTGPAWPTCNIWTKDVRRLVLLQPERVNYSRNIQHAANVEEVREYLTAQGML